MRDPSSEGRGGTRRADVSSRSVTMNKTDIRLKEDIEQELRWDPLVDAAQIDVTVDKGGVSLLGVVETCAAKWAAEGAAKRVSGVRSVTQSLTVQLSEHRKRSDSQIVEAAMSALAWHVYVPQGVTASVRYGWVTLEGRATGNYQRDAAERAVRYLAGVVGITNSITLVTDASALQVKERIQSALQRQATTDANSIHVDASGGKVTLTGSASSWQSIEDAANAAWAAPGVTEVVDRVKRVMTF
jgi:osmotically-inducible protein OsmY